MKTKQLELILVTLIVLMLVVCKSDANDVATLKTQNAPREETPTDVEETFPTDEEKMTAFTQFMRDEGIELVDADVDVEGNVQRPTIAEGVQVSREAYVEAMDVCSKHLEGLTLGRERQDTTEALDQRVALATCLREKGYDVEDPTAETLEQ